MYAYKCMLTMYLQIYAYNVLKNVYLQDPGKCNNNYAYKVMTILCLQVLTNIIKLKMFWQMYALDVLKCMCTSLDSCMHSVS